MNEFGPTDSESINENAITREEMLKIRDEARRRANGGATLEASGVAKPEENRFANIFDPDFKGDIEAAAVRPDDKAARMDKVRTAADHKYQSVRNAGATHEEAEAAADRVWKSAGF